MTVRQNGTDEVDEVDDWAARGVVVDVPMAPSSLRVLRLVAANAAADLGMAIELVEGLTHAVDELASLLITSGRGQRLTVSFDHSVSTLVVHGWTGSNGPVPDTDRTMRELLDLIVGAGRWSVDVASGHLRFCVEIEIARTPSVA